MKKIEEFGVDVNNFNITPFFQVKKENRVRFGTEVFVGRTQVLKEIINELFDCDEEIDSSFIIGKVSNSNKIRYNKIGLNKFFKINNWKETFIKSDDLDLTVIFASIKRLGKNDVFNYCKSIVLGQQQAYIMFYNDSFLLYISSDVIDIISKEENKVSVLRTNYYDIVDKYYE